MVAHSSILDLIGNTPVVDVSKLSPNPNVKIFAKLENQNPAGSVKDRIAKSMVLQAEEDGLLKPGSTLIEPSSGNTGIARNDCINEKLQTKDRIAKNVQLNENNC